MRAEPKIKRKSRVSKQCYSERKIKQAVDTFHDAKSVLISFKATSYMVKDWVTILAARVCTLKIDPLVAQGLLH